MKEQIIYVIKHYPIIQKVYIYFMSAVFRFLGLFIKQDKSLILFVSYMGKGFNDSPKVIYDQIKSNSDYNGYKCVWAFEKPEVYSDIDCIKIDTFSYFCCALKAKYWVTNTNIERGLQFKKKSTVYLNTWHGTALKLIGNDCPNRNDFNFKSVNYLTVSSEYDEKVFTSAFRARKNSFLRCGLPRNDYLWRVNHNQSNQIRKQFGAENKKIILYAPTWRDSTDGGKTYQISPPVHFDQWKEMLGDKYIVLFRAHHQTSSVIGVDYDEFVKNVTDYPAVNDLMVAADLLITDYSAISFDFSILEKPILIYAYDYDTYLSERGTYFNMEDVFPNPICRTEDELLKQIRDLDYDVATKKVSEFKNTFNQFGGKAAEMCINCLFNNTSS